MLSLNNQNLQGPSLGSSCVINHCSMSMYGEADRLWSGAVASYLDLKLSSQEGQGSPLTEMRGKSYEAQNRSGGDLGSCPASRAVYVSAPRRTE